MLIHIDFMVANATLESDNKGMRWTCDEPRLLSDLEKLTPYWASKAPAQPGDIARDIADQAVAFFGGKIQKIEAPEKKRTKPPPPGVVL